MDPWWEQIFKLMGIGGGPQTYPSPLSAPTSPYPSPLSRTSPASVIDPDWLKGPGLGKIPLGGFSDTDPTGERQREYERMTPKIDWNASLLQDFGPSDTDPTGERARRQAEDEDYWRAIEHVNGVNRVQQPWRDLVGDLSPKQPYSPPDLSNIPDGGSIKFAGGMGDQLKDWANQMKAKMGWVPPQAQGPYAPLDLAEENFADGGLKWAEPPETGIEPAGYGSSPARDRKTALELIAEWKAQNQRPKIINPSAPPTRIRPSELYRRQRSHQESIAAEDVARDNYRRTADRHEGEMYPDARDPADIWTDNPYVLETKADFDAARARYRATSDQALDYEGKTRGDRQEISSAIRAYTEAGASLNDPLVKGMSLAEAKKMRESLPWSQYNLTPPEAALREIYKRLDRATRLQHTDQPTTWKRVWQKSPWGEEGPQPGDTFTNPGFTSVTANEYALNRYREGGRTWDEYDDWTPRNPVVQEISVPEGYPHSQVNPFENILPRNPRFRIDEFIKGERFPTGPGTTPYDRVKTTLLDRKKVIGSKLFAGGRADEDEEWTPSPYPEGDALDPIDARGFEEILRKAYPFFGKRDQWGDWERDRREFLDEHTARLEAEGAFEGLDEDAISELRYAPLRDWEDANPAPVADETNQTYHKLLVNRETGENENQRAAREWRESILNPKERHSDEDVATWNESRGGNFRMDRNSLERAYEPYWEQMHNPQYGPYRPRRVRDWNDKTNPGRFMDDLKTAGVREDPEQEVDQQRTTPWEGEDIWSPRPGELGDVDSASLWVMRLHDQLEDYTYRRGMPPIAKQEAIDFAKAIIFDRVDPRAYLRDWAAGREGYTRDQGNITDWSLLEGEGYRTPKGEAPYGATAEDVGPAGKYPPGLANRVDVNFPGPARPPHSPSAPGPSRSSDLYDRLEEERTIEQSARSQRVERRREAKLEELASLLMDYHHREVEKDLSMTRGAPDLDDPDDDWDTEGDWEPVAVDMAEFSRNIDDMARREKNLEARFGGGPPAIGEGPDAENRPEKDLDTYLRLDQERQRRTLTSAEKKEYIRIYRRLQLTRTTPVTRIKKGKPKEIQSFREAQMARERLSPATYGSKRAYRGEYTEDEVPFRAGDPIENLSPFRAGDRLTSKRKPLTEQEADDFNRRWLEGDDAVRRFAARRFGTERTPMTEQEAAAFNQRWLEGDESVRRFAATRFGMERPTDPKGLGMDKPMVIEIKGRSPTDLREIYGSRYVYGGRAGRGERGDLGNPFERGAPHPTTKKPMTNADAIDLYTRWVRGDKRLAKLVNRQPPTPEQIRSLKGKVLACPGKHGPGERCHLDVLAEMAARMRD